MRQLAGLAVVYLLVAGLVLPSSPIAADGTAASDGRATAPDATSPAEPGPAVQRSEPAVSQSTPAAPQSEPQPAPGGEAPAPAGDAAASEQAAADAASERPEARAAAPGSVTMRDFSFSPRTITVNEGDSVTWRNAGREPHSATATDGSFDTGTFPGGASRSARFDKPGSFAYICTPHPFMKGTVRVRAAAAGSQPSEAGSGAADSAQTGGGSGSAPGGSAGAPGSRGAGRSGPALPESGAEAEALAVLGVLMLGLGVAMRRRAAA